MPNKPIPKANATAGLLAQIMVSKYVDHLPLYRQEQILKRNGIDLPRSTLCNWVRFMWEVDKPDNRILKKRYINK